MKLETPDGRFFSLVVEEYEFPDEDLGPTEDNPATSEELMARVARSGLVRL